MIEEKLAKLDPKTRERFKLASEYSLEKQLTPSLGMNIALQGGLGYGRQVLIWGNKSSGKSTFCLLMIAQAQKEGKACAWIDAEGTFDKEWAKRLGVNVDELVVSDSKTISDFAREGIKLCEAAFDIIVVDSISVLLPAAYFSDKGELKDVNDSKQIGSKARDLEIAINQVLYANKKSLLVLISQQRNKFGAQHASFIPTGGHAVMFNSSTVIKLWSSVSDSEAIKGQFQNGDKVFEEAIGRPVTWIVEYNKTGPMNRSGKYDFYYQGDFVGIDTIGETLDYAIKYGIVQQGGAWLTVGEERIQGRAKAVQYLKDNADIQEDLRRQLLATV